MTEAVIGCLIPPRAQIEAQLITALLGDAALIEDDVPRNEERRECPETRNEEKGNTIAHSKKSVSTYKICAKPRSDWPLSLER